MAWEYMAIGLLGLGMFLAVSTLLGAGALNGLPERPPLENERRSRLVERSRTYRLSGQIVDELAAINLHYIGERSRSTLAQALRLIDGRALWKPEEYIACRQVEAVVAGVAAGGVVGFFTSAWVGIVVGSVVGVAYFVRSVSTAHKVADLRRLSIKRRMPFAVDLMAMMLQAGSGFHEALVTVVRESSGHPLGDELREVINQIDLGLPRSQSLKQFDLRVGDPDIKEFIAAIVKGEELGTPLSTIMHTQADQMRLRRSQWGEKTAAEAEIRMSFPILGIMLACMLLVLGPFVIPQLISLGN